MVAKIETQIVYKRKTELLNGQNNLKDTEINTDLNGKSYLFNTSNSKNNEKNLTTDQKILSVTEEYIEEDVTLPAQIGTDHTFKRKVVWFNAIGFLILHMLGLIGIIIQILGYSKHLTNLYAILLTTITAMGITMGAHRYFSHRAFKAKTWLKITLLVMHTMVGQNCLYIWVRDHRQHHKYSDTDADPHNATRGFFFSHIGWLMSKKHPKVIEYGKKIDMSDLEADPWVMFQKDHYKKLYVIFTLLIPTAIPCLLWGEDPIISLFVTFFARTVVMLNFTWSVNSVAHMFGNRPYDKNILPVQSKLVSILAAGEGWHNYHHAFPWDYRTAELGMPWNLTTTLIDWLAERGHIYDRKFVSETMLKNRIARTGDGTHTKYGTAAMAQETNESETKEDELNTNPSTSNTTSNKDTIRKYIVDKKGSTGMLDKLETYSKIDGLNNNEMNDINSNNEKSLKNRRANSKQMLNVST